MLTSIYKINIARLWHRWKLISNFSAAIQSWRIFPLRGENCMFQACIHTLIVYCSMWVIGSMKSIVNTKNLEI